MTSIMVINAKGGSGKTTISINLASYYATKGLKVTLVDLDPQGSSSKWLASRPLTKAKIRGVSSLPPQKVSNKADDITILMFQLQSMALDYKPTLKKPERSLCQYYPHRLICLLQKTSSILLEA